MWRREKKKKAEGDSGQAVFIYIGPIACRQKSKASLRMGHMGELWGGCPFWPRWLGDGRGKRSHWWACDIELCHSLFLEAFAPEGAPTGDRENGRSKSGEVGRCI